METTIETPKTQPYLTLTRLAVTSLTFGATAFGFTMLQQIKALVYKHHWMTEEEFNEGLAMVQFYPGPIMVNLMTYIGYRLFGVRGAIITTTGFVLPSFILMLILSELYFTAGQLPWVSNLLIGLEALIVGLIFQIALDFSTRNIQNRVQAFIALMAFVALSLKVDSILIIFSALLIGSILLRPELKEAYSPKPSDRDKQNRRSWIPILVVAFCVLGGVVFAGLLHSDVGRMGLTFFKIGALAFGTGTTIIPLIQADVVEIHHWLTQNQFIDGIALGQITPGPFLITAAFIGYKLGGLAGASLATFAMFSPSFVMTLLAAQGFSRLRNLRFVRGMLGGILASFAGLLAVVTIQLGSHAIKEPLALVLAAGGFVALRYFKISVIWIIFGGLLIWWSMWAIGFGATM